MIDDRLRCRCANACTERATQEDMLCDVCRRGDGMHMHVGPVPPDVDLASWRAGPMMPMATSGEILFL